MKIGVSGAGGHLGRAIVDELRAKAAGHEIIGISRHPDLIGGDMERRFGDYDQVQSLVSAYSGLDRVVIIPTPDLAQDVRRRQHLNAVDAACSAKVDHILFISAVGTHDVAEPSVAAAYFPAEQQLMRHAKSWTILRMNYFIETFLDEARAGLNAGALAGLAEHRAGFVSREDVAAAAAGILHGQGRRGAIYNATGPRLYSGAERCAAISAAAGKPIEFVAMPEESLRDILLQSGMNPALADLIVNLQRALAEGSFDIVTGDVERLAGRPPRSLEEALAQAFP